MKYSYNLNQTVVFFCHCIIARLSFVLKIVLGMLSSKWLDKLIKRLHNVHQCTFVHQRNCRGFSMTSQFIRMGRKQSNIL